MTIEVFMILPQRSAYPHGEPIILMHGRNANLLAPGAIEFCSNPPLNQTPKTKMR